MLEAALAYAARGWPVIPLHSVNAELACTCSSVVCSSPGKHPITRHGVKDATTDAAAITDWFKTYNFANVGICTGTESGVFVLDIDPRHDGDKHLRELEAREGDLPETLLVDTGGGGLHYFFVAPRGTLITNSRGRLPEGVDVRGEGGYVVAAPSRHVSGKNYAWREPLSAIAEPPEWLISLARRRKAAGTSTITKRFKSGGRSNALIGIAGALRRQGSSRAIILAALLAENRERCEPPLSDAEVEKIATSGAKYTPDPLIAALAETAWGAQLSRDKNGNVKSTLRNIALILSNSDEWVGRLGFNERKQQYVFLKPPPFLRGLGVQIVEEDIGKTAIWLEQEYKFAPSVDKVATALFGVASDTSFDPVVDYLSTLAWDGTPRIDAWLTTYCGARDTVWTRAVGAKWLISAVARAGDPGCKVDHALVFEGMQGVGKSRTFAILGGDWFSDDVSDFGSKSAAEQLQGPWIIELSELAAVRRTDQETLKSFMTRQSDDYRGAYERKVQARPRRCVLGGSTNRADWLRDPSGGRRFWPVEVKRVDQEALTRDRDQLWAEASARWLAGEKWHLDTAELNDVATLEQQERLLESPWEELIANHLVGRTVTTTKLILSEVFGIEKKEYDRHSPRVGEILLNRMKWVRRNRSHPTGGQRIVYMHPDHIVTADKIDWKGLRTTEDTMKAAQQRPLAVVK